MAYECTDITNKEQFVVRILWVDDTFTYHENIIGVYNIDTIDARTLTSAIYDELLSMNLKMSQCLVQCYDGSANMTGCEDGFATRLLADESGALLIHC